MEPPSLSLGPILATKVIGTNGSIPNISTRTPECPLFLKPDGQLSY